MDRAGLRLVPLALVLLFGCGRTDGAADTPDGGAPQDTARASDAGSQHDAATGCDSGELSVQCVSAADSTHLNGPVAVDDQNVYWAAIGQGPEDSFIMRKSRAGGLAVTLGEGYPGLSLVSDGEFVYWNDSYCGPAWCIKRVPVAGGSVTTLAAASAPTCLAVDDSSVYWTDNDSGIIKIAKTGGATVTLAPATGGDGQFDIAVDATTVYWGGAGISSVSKEGGAVTTLQAVSVETPTDNCRSMALVGDTLFIIGGGMTFDGLESLRIADPDNPVHLTSSGGPTRVVATSTELFWQGYGTAIEINETPVAGGPTTTLATPPAQSIEDMAVASDGTLYWTTDLQVQSLKP
jgi:hypothetical protein